ncbi:MAG: hypothetical protein CME62_02800 [Halobacteriovoraceae bacterium]|nr:hypothetical protein [Halobacteriovoraceae bacterium]|tara:strand:+ start:11054 stop:12655 length:1602 start_codon:yes stop_codon:yes gene_type:complete
MNNILILNLGTTKEILDSSHLIAAYKKENPHSEVSVLTYDENLSICQTLVGVSQIYTLNQTDITELVANPLYSDAHALNQFSQDLYPVLEKEWSHAINYSNNEASSYLMGALSAETKIGTFIDHNGVARTSDEWSTFQNYVTARSERFSIALPIVRNHIAGVPFHKDCEKIKINPEFLYVSNQNFNRVRSMNGKQAKYIVGINLEVGYDGLALTEQTVNQTIEALIDSADYQVVLLTSGKGYQKEMVNNLNAEYNNSLVSINVNSVALSSVLSNLDILVSTANDQLVMADCLEVRVIEIKERELSSPNPSTYFEGNHIIYTVNNENLSSDILLCLNEAFETELPIEVLESNNQVYLSVCDDYAQYYSQIRGEINLHDEISYHVERAMHFEILGYPRHTKLIEQLNSQLPKEEINSFVEKARTQATQITKALLATLKSLKEVNSQAGLNRFLTDLDNVMQFAAENHTAASLVKLFEGRVENITSTDPVENLKEIESLLFKLKSDIQLYVNILAELTTDAKQSEKSTPVVTELTN